MMFGDSQNRVVKNSLLLYIMVAAKMFLPLVLLPYLTRVLTKDVYGVVSYVKSLMMYAQIVIDFGFMLSATKDVALACRDRHQVNFILGDVLVARVILSIFALFGTVLAVFFIPLLRPYVLFTLLSFIPVFLTIFLFDYFFRGIEQMGVITSRFVIMRTIAVVLTFFFVHDDQDVIFIPILDSVGTMVGVAFVFYEVLRRGYRLKYSGICSALARLRDSFVYFLSNVATTTFGALNTILIGVLLGASSVAEWSICFQCVMAAQQCYYPITDSLYPHMIKKRDIKLAMRIFFGFSLVVLAGCVLTYFASDFVVLAIGGEKYNGAGMLLRAFIPLLFVSFPAVFFGWPMLGSIGLAKEVTSTTIVTGGLQIIGFVALALLNDFTLINLALLRGATDFFLFASRFFYCYMNRALFNQRIQ